MWSPRSPSLIQRGGVSSSPPPPQDGDSVPVAVYGNVGSGCAIATRSGKAWPLLLKGAVELSVGWGPPASALPSRAQGGWRGQRAPCPSLAGFCLPPTWAPGQALRQGPVQGNNTPVFPMVDGGPKDEEGETCTEKGRDGVGEGALSQGYTGSCGVSQRSPWVGGGGCREARKEEGRRLRGHLA